MAKVLDLSKVLGTASVIESICNWNATRYIRELNVALTVALLEEEMDETVDAADTNNLLKICDGYADVFYVAIGGMWKHGLSHLAIIALIDEMSIKVGALPMVYASIEEYDETENVSELALIALKAVEGLEGLTNTDSAFAIIRAVCDSNDTKAVKKTDSADKGDFKCATYVSPDKAIKKVLDSLVEKPK